jgi:hypothetical protein
MLGFKQFRNAAVTIAGIELMHRIPNNQSVRSAIADATGTSGSSAVDVLVYGSAE